MQPIFSKPSVFPVYYFKKSPRFLFCSNTIVEPLGFEQVTDTLETTSTLRLNCRLADVKNLASENERLSPLLKVARSGSCQNPCAPLIRIIQPSSLRLSVLLIPTLVRLRDVNSISKSPFSPPQADSTKKDATRKYRNRKSNII